MNLSEDSAEEILDLLTFKDGLISAICRDSEDNEVLMTAFMNREAVMKTLTTGVMHYWSRSRQELWKKGEESGNLQKVKSLRIDCDGDAVLFDVLPEGPACHKGYRSCFYRRITEDGDLEEILEREFDPKKVYD